MALAAFLKTSFICRKAGIIWRFQIFMSESLSLLRPRASLNHIQSPQLSSSENHVKPPLSAVKKKAKNTEPILPEFFTPKKKNASEAVLRKKRNCQKNLIAEHSNLKLRELRNQIQKEEYELARLELVFRNLTDENFHLENLFQQVQQVFPFLCPFFFF